MDEILKMLFREILSDIKDFEEIKTIHDLYNASYRQEILLQIFAVINNDQDGFSTEEILEIANAAYQEVRTHAQYYL